MSDLPVQEGDQVKVSHGSESTTYEVTKSSPGEIYIRPVDDPTQLSKLVLINGDWRVFQAEHIPYEIVFIQKFVPQPVSRIKIPLPGTRRKLTRPAQAQPFFEPAPRPVSPPPVQPTVISTREAADICLDLMLNRKITGIDQEKINEYAQSENYPLPDNPRAIRTTCEPIIRLAIEEITPGVNVENLFGPRLAGFYAREKEKIEETLIERRRRDEIRRQKELILLKQMKMTRAIETELTDIREEEVRTLKGEATDQCLGTPKLRNVSLPPVENPILQYRQIYLPSDLWSTIIGTRVRLVENPEIVEQLQLILGYDLEEIEQLSDQIVRELLGEELVRQIERPVYLRIEGHLYPEYAVIAGYTPNSQLEMSKYLFDNLNQPSHNLRISDCKLGEVASIHLNLLRLRDIPDVGDVFIRESLITELSNLRILVVGDILSVQVEDKTLEYRIESLTTDEGVQAYAASIPQVSEEITLTIDTESQDELFEKLSPRIPDLDIDLI